MQSIVVHPYRKRFAFAVLLIAALTYLFWTGSRYPALDEKAMMSGAIQLEDPLGFEAKFQLTPDMNVVERVFYSTLNWIDTNKKGMTFGILFAAAFLTATAYLKQKSFRGSFSNSFLGLVIGTPLGVCVNCAAPIARGMYSGGMRAETTLSAMIASPTLNIIVLTMLFSLLPVYMALTKIALSLVIILLVVPLICRVLPSTQIAPDPSIPAPSGWSSADLSGGAPSEAIVTALIAVAVNFAANLWFIVKMTVPLMLLAGFLGALTATLLPGEMILGREFGLIALILIAIVGVFLPVPIAFDVVVTGALLSLGLEQGYVMALLFTLGSFSVYSFFIVAQSVAMRAAVLLSLAVLVGGIGAGLGAHYYHGWQTQRALEKLLGGIGDALPVGAAWAAGADPYQVTSPDAERIAIDAVPFQQRSAPGEAPFSRVEAWQAGIDKPLEFTFQDMWPPFWEGRSVASGDIDRDGDLDLVIASTEAGLYLYDNDGSGQFIRLAADLGALVDMPVFNAALADIDNDGWQDLFIATYREGNFLVPNAEGRFDFSALQPVQNRPGAILSIALSLADPDRDGDLDVVLGNWAAGWYRRVPGEESRNRILWNQQGALTGDSYLDLPGLPGETLSILFSDIDADGQADLLVGNDFEMPDYFYYGDGAGGFRMVTYADGLIPHTTTTTMAVKTADLQNDGVPEIYLAQIAGRSSGVSKALKMQPLALYCDGIGREADRAACEFNMQIKTWYKSGNNFDPTYAGKCQELAGRYQAECKAMLVKDLAIQQNDPAICALIPKDQPRARSFCELHFLPVRQPTAQEAEASLQQILRANVLLEWQGDAYADTAEAQGLEVGGWSWDTKIADFDNDGFQDVYIVNGTWVPNEVSPSNLFYHNQGDGTFAEASGPFGLEDYLMTAAATAFDIDNDGDLDLVTHPVNGPLALFRNNDQAGNAIAFEFDDRAGNRDGIGARVEIVDSQGRRQSREVQLGGGFMSFDAPRVHFGLGSADTATQVVIRWATGGETVIDGPVPAGALYRIGRAPG